MRKCIRICIEEEDEDEENVKLTEEQVNEVLNDFSQVIMRIISHLSTVEDSGEATESERET